MRAYEFVSTVDNGIIHIPEQYRDKITSSVKVIVLSEEPVKSKVLPFSALRIDTKGFKFNREEANER